MKHASRLPQLTNIRAFVIFLVVLGHSIILYSSTWDLYLTDVDVPLLDALKKLIDAVQMPLFFSLSGYLFVFTHGKNRPFSSLIQNKSLRLLVPYISIGLLFMLPIRLIVAYPGYQGKSITALLFNFLTSSDVGHLWFLPALFVIFLISEIILRIADRIPGLRQVPDLFLGIVAAALYLEGYRISFNYPPIQTAYFYLIWFAAGYILSSRQNLLSTIYQHTSVKIILGSLSFALQLWQIFVAPTSVLFSICTKFLLIASFYGIMPHQTHPLVEKVDRNSFGIYLFHSPLIYITYSYIPNANPLLVVFINLVIFGAAAYGLTNLLRKSKLKAIIGE